MSDLLRSSAGHGKVFVSRSLRDPLLSGNAEMSQATPPPNKSFFAICLLFLLSIVASWDALFAPREFGEGKFLTHTGHSWDYNIWRIVSLAYSFADYSSGRWIETMYFGWGYPLFEFTGSLPYRIGAIFALLGFESNAALNMMWFFGYLAAALAMYWAVSQIGGPWAGLLAAASYTMAPYHAVDIYVRTNLGEFTSFIFPPLILGALWKGATKPKEGVIIGAIAIALLAHTHLLSTLLTAVGFIVFTPCFVITVRKGERLNILGTAFLSAMLGGMLAASFILPAAVDVSLVRGEQTLTSGYTFYGNHFVDLQQLISPFWGYGESTFGTDDQMPFTVGRYLLTLTVLSLGVTVFAVLWNGFCVLRERVGVKEQSIEDRNATWRCFSLAVSAAGAALCCIALTLVQSEIVWARIPKLATIQFPWRYLFPASFFLAVSVGVLPVVFASFHRSVGKLLAPLCVILSISLVWVYRDYARANSYDSVSALRVKKNEMIQKGISTSNAGEFLPLTTKHEPSIPRKGIGEMWLNYSIQGERVLFSESRNGWGRFELGPGPPATLVLHQLFYPAWKAYVDGIPQPVRPFQLHPYTLVSVEVPEDAQSVVFSIEETRFGFFGLILTCIGAGIWITLLGAQFLGRPGTGIILLSMIFISGSCFFGLRLKTRFVREYSPTQKKAAAISSTVDLNSLNIRKRSGAAWDAVGNIKLLAGGVRVTFPELQRASWTEISLDANDRYNIIYFNSNRVIGLVDTGDFSVPHYGLKVFSIETPAAVQAIGFDGLGILPVAGDGNYSMGHLLLSTINDGNSDTTISKQKIELDTFSGRKEVPHEAVMQPRSVGTPWDAPGNIHLSRNGVKVNFPKLQTERDLEMSTDHNDFYTVLFLRNNEIIKIEILPPVGSGFGLTRHNIKLIDEVGAFDAVIILPFLGDGSYSLGHLLLR